MPFSPDFLDQFISDEKKNHRSYPGNALDKVGNESGDVETGGKIDY